MRNSFENHSATRGTRGSPQMFVFLEDLNKPQFEDLNEYLSAVIRFHVDIALNRYNKGILEITATLGASMLHIENALKSN